MKRGAGALAVLLALFWIGGYAQNPVLRSTGATAYTALNAANNLSDVANAGTARSNLGLGTAATQNTGVFAQVANNLSDLASASTARANLGVAAAPLVGTSGSISGALTIGTCNTATVAVTGATTSMVAGTSPVSNPDSGATGLVRWDAYVSSANVVTVRECGLGIVTPNATAYNVRVLP